MNIHERNARYLADTSGPMGALCRGLLDLLDAAREDSIWAQAIAEYAEERGTLGGIPMPYTATWDNAALPVADVHTDYRGL